MTYKTEISSTANFQFLHAGLRVTTLTFLAVLIPNSGFLLIADWLDLSRPLFNVDYVLALVFSAFGWRKTGTALTLGFTAIEAVTLVSQLFPFAQFSDLLYLIRFSTTASTFHLVLIAGGIAILIAKTYLSAITNSAVPRLNALIALNTLILFGLIYGYVSEPKSQRSTLHSIHDENPVLSQSMSLYKLRSKLFWAQFEETENVLSATPAGATAPWFNGVQKANTNEQLLLILNESWGVPVDPKIQESLIAPLLAAASERFEYGTFRRNGFTLDGELRELCMLQARHFNLEETQEGFEDCLPNKLRAAGYSTASVHGATGLMYGRTHWYPRAGFGESTFFESRVWPRRCYSFPGACDRDLFSEVGKYFKAPGKQFLYWLTLNTHASFDERDIHRRVFDCRAHRVPPASESCRNLQLQAQFFVGLAELLRTGALGEIDIILVGDHPPMILDQKEKREIFSADAIPWLRIGGRAAEDRNSKTEPHSWQSVVKLR